MPHFCRPSLCHHCHQVSPLHVPITISAAPVIARHRHHPFCAGGCLTANLVVTLPMPVDFDRQPLCYPCCLPTLSPSLPHLLLPHCNPCSCLCPSHSTLLRRPMLLPLLPPLMSLMMSPLLTTNYQSENNQQTSQQTSQRTSQYISKQPSQSSNQSTQTSHSFKQQQSIKPINMAAPSTLDIGQTTKWPITYQQVRQPASLANQPVYSSANWTTRWSVDQRIIRPTSPPTSQLPVSQAVIQPGNQPNSHSIGQFCHPASQPTNQSINSPASLPTVRTADQETSQSDNQQVNQPGSQQNSQTANQSVNLASLPNSKSAN